jgi:hypothetical protein
MNAIHFNLSISPSSFYFFSVSEINTVRQTDVIGAGRDQSVIDPMMAQVALLSDAFMMVKVNGIIRARFNTCLTAGAQVIIHDHDTIGSFADGFLWAGFGTGWIIAVPALIDPVNEIEQPVDHMGTVLCDRNEFDAVSRPVFLFAGDFTRFASPTGLVVNDQGICYHEPPPRLTGYILQRSVLTEVAPIAGSHVS